MVSAALKRVVVMRLLFFKEAAKGLKQTMAYQLVPASIEDEVWLERLPRDVYQELFMATFGGWDEARHERQFGECLNRGGYQGMASG